MLQQHTYNTRQAPTQRQKAVNLQWKITFQLSEVFKPTNALGEKLQRAHLLSSSFFPPRSLLVVTRGDIMILFIYTRASLSWKRESAPSTK